MATVQYILSCLTSQFEEADVPNAQGSAAWIVEEVLGAKPHEVHVMRERELTASEQAQIERAAVRRQHHEPLQYIFGHSAFYGRDFAMSAPVFIPRPETEVLAEYLIAHVSGAAHVCELCCGSGALACTLALERPDITVVAADISRDAVELTKRNVAKHDVQARVHVYKSDLFGSIAPDVFDALVANPPYIPLHMSDVMDAEVLAYEDHRALFSGKDGLDVFRAIVAGALQYLRQDGLFACELETSNVREAADLLRAQQFEDVRVMCDMAHRERFIVARRGGNTC